MTERDRFGLLPLLWMLVMIAALLWLVIHV